MNRAMISRAAARQRTSDDTETPALRVWALKESRSLLERRNIVGTDAVSPQALIQVAEYILRGIQAPVIVKGLLR